LLPRSPFFNQLADSVSCLRGGEVRWTVYRLPLLFPASPCVVMVVYLREALQQRIAAGVPITNDAAAIEGAVHRLRPKLMTVTAVLASLAPILAESGIGSDVTKPIVAPIVGGMITSTTHALILVPGFFVLMKQRALRRGTLAAQEMHNRRNCGSRFVRVIKCTVTQSR